MKPTLANLARKSESRVHYLFLALTADYRAYYRAHNRELSFPSSPSTSLVRSLSIASETCQSAWRRRMSSMIEKPGSRGNNRLPFD